MNLGLEFGMNMGLEQKLSPQMIQSLQLLQMNSMELEMTVKQELEANPMLESADDPEDVGDEDEREDPIEREDSDEDEGEAPVPESGFEEGGALPSDGMTDVAAPERADEPLDQEIDWESYLEDGYETGESPREERDHNEDVFERTPVYDKSLQDHLLAQLHDRELKPEIFSLVEYLIYSLDDRGYLTSEGPTDPEAGEKLASLDHDPLHLEVQAVLEGRREPAEADARVREALHVLQSFEPAGVGARNLRECLLLQIRRSARISPMARRIVEEDFDLLERLKIAALARKYEAPPDEVQAAIKEIGTLEPHPGRLLGTTAASAVVPDLLVEEVEGELVLMLNDRTVPSLRISRTYAGLLRKGSKATADEKKFVRGKLNSATWLIRAIEQRKSTMLKVMQAIIESQPEFFKVGPAHLRPLILQHVADKIGMHISTVSRVTNGKYVQTPHGIFELKYFFTAGVTQADGSEVSSVAAKDEIKKLIESEDPRHPLSDQKIVEVLKENGLDVARRTVAKYRDQLEILPARMRKKY